MSDAPAPPLHALSEALADTVATAASSVVEVHSRRLRASGFAYGPDLIVTADEALAESGPVEVVLSGGERRPAAIVGRDPGTDVALLRVEGVSPFLKRIDEEGGRHLVRATIVPLLSDTDIIRDGTLITTADCTVAVAHTSDESANHT